MLQRRIVGCDDGHRQAAQPLKLGEANDTGCGLFGHTLEMGVEIGPVTGHADRKFTTIVDDVVGFRVGHSQQIGFPHLVGGTAGRVDLDAPLDQRGGDIVASRPWIRAGSDDGGAGIGQHGREEGGLGFEMDNNCDLLAPKRSVVDLVSDETIEYR